MIIRLNKILNLQTWIYLNIEVQMKMMPGYRWCLGGA